MRCGGTKTASLKVTRTDKEHARDAATSRVYGGGRKGLRKMITNVSAKAGGNGSVTSPRRRNLQKRIKKEF